MNKKELEKKVDRLNAKCDWVYLHNSNGQSYLAVYDSREHLYRSPLSAQFHINLRERGFFFDKIKVLNREVVVPTKYLFEMGISIMEEQLLKGEFELYIGKDEIKEGMEKHSNLSYNLMYDVTNNFSFNIR